MFHLTHLPCDAHLLDEHIVPHVTVRPVSQVVQQPGYLDTHAICERDSQLRLPCSQALDESLRQVCHCFVCFRFPRQIRAKPRRCVAFDEIVLLIFFIFVMMACDEGRRTTAVVLRASQATCTSNNIPSSASRKHYSIYCSSALCLRRNAVHGFMSLAEPSARKSVQTFDLSRLLYAPSPPPMHSPSEPATSVARRDGLVTYLRPNARSACVCSPETQSRSCRVASTHADAEIAECP